MLFCKEITEVTHLRRFPQSLFSVMRFSRLNPAGLLVLLLWIPIVSADDDSGVVRINGTVVAFDYVKSQTPCYKGTCEGSLIVRVDGPEPTQTQYIRVDIRYALDRPPKQLVQHSRQWRLQLLRTRNLDESISQVITLEKDAHGKERQVPIWKLIPGAESEKLPFGKVLRSYTLLKNGFKAVV